MTNILGFREPKTDFLETAGDRGMFNLLGTWPEDDPHPLDKMAQKATDFVTQTVVRRNALPDMAKPAGKIAPSLDFGFTPVHDQGRKGLMSNFDTGASDANKQLRQTMLSVGAGDHTDGGLIAGQYRFFSSPESATIKRDETFTQARQRSQDITQPQAGMSDVQKGFASIATRNQQKGFEMEQPMGMFVEANSSPVFPASADAESRFSHDVSGAWGNMAGDNWPAMTQSAHNADTSYPKTFEDDPERYRAFLNRMAQPGPGSVRDARETEGMNIGKNADDFLKGARTTLEQGKNTLAKAFLMTGKTLEELTGHELLFSARQSAQEIYDRNKRLDQGLAEFVKWDDIYVPDQPDKTLENLQAFTYQSIFGRYSFDLASLYLTRGWGYVANTATRVFGAASDLYVQDLVENGNDDFVGALKRGYKVGSAVSESEYMLNSLTNQLDPYSRMGLRFMIRQMSDEEQKKLLNNVIQEQRQKQNHQRQA